MFAAALSRHPAVLRIDYPGLPEHPGHQVARRLFDAGPEGVRFGAIVTVTPHGGREAGMALADKLRLAEVATSLGGTHTVVSHVASTTHRQLDDRALAAGGHRSGRGTLLHRPGGRGGPRSLTRTWPWSPSAGHSLVAQLGLSGLLAVACRGARAHGREDAWRKIRVAVVFGGRSSEHAVSCASAGRVLSAIDRDRYDVLPIGIATDGRWVLTSGDPARLALSAARCRRLSRSALPGRRSPRSAGRRSA